MTYTEQIIKDKFGFTLPELDIKKFTDELKMHYGFGSLIWDELEKELNSNSDLDWLHRLVLRANAFRVSELYGRGTPLNELLRSEPELEVKVTKYVAVPVTFAYNKTNNLPTVLDIDTTVHITAVLGNKYAVTDKGVILLGELSDSKVTVSREFQPLLSERSFEDITAEVYGTPDKNSPHFAAELFRVAYGNLHIDGIPIAGAVNGFDKIAQIGYVLVEEFVQKYKDALVISYGQTREWFLGNRPNQIDNDDTEWLAAKLKAQIIGLGECDLESAELNQIYFNKN